MMQIHNSQFHSDEMWYGLAGMPSPHLHSRPLGLFSRHSRRKNTNQTEREIFYFGLKSNFEKCISVQEQMFEFLLACLRSNGKKWNEVHADAGRRERKKESEREKERAKERKRNGRLHRRIQKSTYLLFKQDDSCLPTKFTSTDVHFCLHAPLLAALSSFVPFFAFFALAARFRLPSVRSGRSRSVFYSPFHAFGSVWRTEIGAFSEKHYYCLN